jgi:preprotein translocase subunit YajC
MNLIQMLAQQATSRPAAPAPINPMFQYAPFIIFGLIFYFFLLRPNSKEKKRRQEQLSSIKKNDRAVTIGGIMGTVVSVKDDEVTLKVDESSNTKITFLKSAIQRVISSGPAEGGDSSKS